MEILLILLLFRVKSKQVDYKYLIRHDIYNTKITMNSF